MGKVKLILILVVTTALIAAVLGFSFTQVKNQTNVPIDIDTICGQSGMIKPIRFQINSSYGMCAWADKLSAIRALVSFLGFVVIVSLIVFSFKKKRFSYLFATVILFIIGGFGGYSSVIDAMAVKTSKENCDQVDITDVYPGASCAYNYFYGTVAVNFGQSLFMIFASIMALKYRSEIMHNHHHHHLGNANEDETQPIINASNISSTDSI